MKIGVTTIKTYDRALTLDEILDEKYGKKGTRKRDFADIKISITAFNMGIDTGNFLSICKMIKKIAMKKLS